MSNVFTKRSGLPRTTTLSDYSNPGRWQKQFITYDRSEPHRALSPTRCHNPHSSGLHYQSAYNRYSQCFGIWHPKSKNKTYFPHLKQTNFSCKHNPTELKERTEAATQQQTYKPRPAPTIKYCTDTIQRRAFHWPKSLLDK